MTKILSSSLEFKEALKDPRYQVILQDCDGSRWLHFHTPIEIISTKDLREIVPLLQRIENLVNEQGYFAAGFVSYEAAPAFDQALLVRQATELPLLWFGIFDKPEEVDLESPAEGYSLGRWQASVSESEYASAFSKIKELIAQGRTYQVNYTLRLRASFTGSPWSLFWDLIQAQDSNYAAYLDLGPICICSASPELFFKLNGVKLESRPMKGTAPRGRAVTKDDQLADWLFKSEKNRAENVMIVDMVRNDFGRVSDVGSVSVPSLFDIERYPTLLQMTSTVTGKSQAAFADIMAALFPCASITGAPKVSTMQIISELETDARSIYTGCIGYLGPGRQAQFNVAIRTVLVDRVREMAEYGVGGGIVWGSEMAREYEEWQTKARILTVRRPIFQLLESILWTPEEGYFLLERHLKRLNDSARYFGFDCDLSMIRDQLDAFILQGDSEPKKVRLIVNRDGQIRLESSLVGTSSPAVIALAAEPINEGNVFYFHKTTHREIYEAARSGVSGVDDVLLWNGQGEITETTTANIVVNKNGMLLTPRVASGLLAGTFREELLEKKKIVEGRVTIADLEEVEEIYLINSVRKWRKGTFLK